MNLSLEVDTKKFDRAMKAASGEVRRELYVALGISVRDIANDAKHNHKFKTKSGELERSIIDEVREDGLYAEVRLEEGIAKYGKYQHDGTKPHIIRPKVKKALHFVRKGVPWFVPKRPMIKGNPSPFWQKIEDSGKVVVWKGYVNHPGIKADQFLYKAFNRQKRAILRRLTIALENAYRKGGL